MPKSADIESVAREFLRLKERKARIEERLAELQPPLKEYLEASADRTAVLAGWKLTLIWSVREIFNLKKAKAKLPKEVLRPYISKSKSCQIRTTYKGGDKKEAA